MERLKLVGAWMLIIITSTVMIGNFIVAWLRPHMVLEFWIMLLVMILFLAGFGQIPKLKTFMITHERIVLITMALVWLIPDIVVNGF